MSYVDILDRLYNLSEQLLDIRNDVDDLMSNNKDYLADMREKEERIEELLDEVAEYKKLVIANESYYQERLDKLQDKIDSLERGK